MVVFILFLAGLCNIAVADEVTVGIQLVEQKIYFVNDDIEIKITLKNKTADTRQFRIADNRVFSLDFDVRTALNRPQDLHSQRFINERNTMKPVFYRDMSLSPGEEYSLVVKFGDFVDVKEPGLYVVQAMFYPDLYISNTAPSLPSNKLTLNLRPEPESPSQKSAIEAQLDRDAFREGLSPDKTVEYMLKARQADHWDKFFLYINLNELYINSFLRDNDSQKQFNRLSEAEKKAKISTYRNQIIADKLEWSLVLRTSEFVIKETKYDSFRATVVVDQIYQHPDYKEPRRYTYTLRKNKDVWEIVDYETKNKNQK